VYQLKLSAWLTTNPSNNSNFNVKHLKVSMRPNDLSRRERWLVAMAVNYLASSVTTFTARAVTYEKTNNQGYSIESNSIVRRDLYQATAYRGYY
jgi:hypothetical protein